MKTRSATMKTRSATMKRSISPNVSIKKSRKSVAKKQVLLLPVEIIWKILEYTGHDTFFAVTGDRVRADTILLSQGQFKKYFDARSFDYCPDRDYRLAKYGNQDCAIRLPLLTDRLFQTYVKTQPHGYVVADDMLLKTFFGVEDTTNLALLIDGKFCEYEKAMQVKGPYDVTKDILLMRYLGASEDNIVECFDRLFDFDRFLRAVNDADHTIVKLFAMRRMRTGSFYSFMQDHKITLPECLFPMNVAKVLTSYSQLFEDSVMFVSKICSECREPSVSRQIGEKMLQTSDWEYLYVILFCSKCANCLLKLPFQSDSDSD
ncbi:LEF-7 [Spodoptera eridania nucleopolyhedrovirus]|uniref:LEF-7 n=1 Tax=Spodoptera eridania nucleopolyhedrovirus TaxID=2315721 RepID=A0A346TPV8_9ABAC|nr:LEF-7 [Spodoptera eridania nucleopolyhedrovirus]AXU41618.1 LEF-7 [Spodoptera eridania nucleopolyhedrovirus]